MLESNVAFNRNNLHKIFSYRQSSHVQIDASHSSLELVYTGGGGRPGSSSNHLDGFDVDTNLLDLLVIGVTVGGGIERLLLWLVEIRPGIVGIVVDGGGGLRSMYADVCMSCG